MALLKAIKTNYGVNANYVSQEVRMQNLNAVAWNNLTFVGDDYIQDVTRTAVYNKLKTGEFSDALDV